MDELPGKPVKCTRKVFVEMADGLKDHNLTVSSTFRGPDLRHDGLLGILESDGDLHLINPRFMTRIQIYAEVESDMEMKESEYDSE